MRSLVKSLLQFARCSSGSVLVESTILLPIAMSLMVGVLGFGMGFWTWATGNKSVRDAARYLGALPSSVLSPGGTWAGCPTWAVTDAQNLAIYGNITGSGSALVPGWVVSGGSNNNVSVDCSTPNVIVVTARFPYNPLWLVPFVPLSSTVTLSAQQREPVVNVCTGVCS
jgi:TadE-like protein